MKYFVLFVFCGCLALEVHSSVLREESTQNNHSNDDAVHKKRDKEDFDQIDQKVKSRRRLAENSDTSGESSRSGEIEQEKDVNDEQLVFGVKTNAKSDEKPSSGVDTILNVLKKIFRGNDSLFRQKKFRLRSSSEKAKPSVGIEIDTKSVIDTIKKFLASPMFKRTANDIAKKAAIVLRSLKEGGNEDMRREIDEPERDVDDQLSFGVKPNGKTNKKSSDMDSIIRTVNNIFQGKATVFKHLKPKEFTLRTSAENTKPTVGLEFDMGSVINSVRELLSSPVVKSAINEFAKKFAIMLRSKKDVDTYVPE